MFNKGKVEVLTAVVGLVLIGASLSMVNDRSVTNETADAIAVPALETTTLETTTEIKVASTTTETTEETKAVATSEAVTSRSASSLVLEAQEKENELQNKDVEQPETSSTESETVAAKAEETTTETVEEQSETEPKDFVWEGTKLTKRAGIVPASQSPSGYKETYYNLPMGGCLRAMGYSADSQEVREDGVKMLNGYVMVATPNLKKYPKGSYIPTSLGMGIVVDYCPSGNLDIATTW